MVFSREASQRAILSVGIDTSVARAAMGTAKPAFSMVSAFEPRTFQRSVLELPAGHGGSLTILEAETGSGKTEAAFARFLSLFHAGEVDGLYFALPTRTASTQIHARMLAAVTRAFAGAAAAPPVILAVPGYLRFNDRVGELQKITRERGELFAASWVRARGDRPPVIRCTPRACWVPPRTRG